MANYPQLDNTRGVWNIKEVYDAIMGGYWPNASGGRAIYVGGAAPSASNVIDYITMASTGDATDFGNLTGNKNTFPGVCSSFTRGLTADATSIDYITYASAGNAADFGDMSVARGYSAGMNNSVRGIWGAGKDPSNNRLNTADYVTMASLGNAVDFGDLTVARQEVAPASSPTRGLACGGQNSGSSPYYTNTIDYLTIMTLGNAADFGDNVNSGTQMSGCSSSTRGTFMGGQQQPASPAYFDTIAYVEIASTGNATDFGDLSAAKTSSAAASNSVRGILAGGEIVGDSTPLNIMEQFTISVGGKVTDFGDLATARKNLAAGSNQNGGLNDGYQGTRPLPAGSGRGFFVGGVQNNHPAATAMFSNIEYFQIPSTGNAMDFGDLTAVQIMGAGASSLTRSAFGGGTPDNSNASDHIDYVESQSLGNAADFGDLTSARKNMFGDVASSSTRGLFAGGSPDTNIIEYITMASIGDAADFGDLQTGKYLGANCSSNTRGIFGGGVDAPAQMNVIDYVTIASTANAADFGDLTVSPSYVGATSSSIRGIWMGGSTPSATDVVQYITIATTGNASDFGDLTDTRAGTKCASNSIRGLCLSGYKAFRSELTTMEYVTIASTGDAADFGDLSAGRYHALTGSDSHGGLTN